MSFPILSLFLCVSLPLATAVQLRSASVDKSAPEHCNKIWTYWHYPGDAGPFVNLNLDTWRHHAPNMQIMLVNNSNIREYVPDLPEEFFRLPYDSAKSDFIRASILYHQGGVYMDTDFLLMKPLTEAIEKLDKYDIVTYADDDSPSGDCGTHHSSNFIVARKGNGFNKVWWKNVRSKLTRTCNQGEFNCEKVCCHEKDEAKPQTRSCHIPWAQLEWLKQPTFDKDRARGGPDLDSTQPSNQLLIKQGKKKCRDLNGGNNGANSTDDPAEDISKDVHTYCLRQEQSMTPHLNGEVYWQPWDSQTKATLSLKKAKFAENDYDNRFNCTEADNGSLDCDEGNWGKAHRKHPKFFERTAYHLFFSTRRPTGKTKEEVLQGDYVLSEMYRRSLGIAKKKVV